jgi:uncharacterized protein (DUF1501 family)
MLIKRRQLLGGMSGMAMLPMFTRALQAREFSSKSSNLILVVIYLNGGNDGLNTVVPLPQYGHYYNLRTPATPPPNQAVAYTESDLELLAFDADYTTPPLSASTFAFAPSMLAMRDLYTTGKLAVINGVGLPLNELNGLSHYNATLDWMTGQINIGLVEPPGWVGQLLSTIPGGSLGPSLSFGGATPLLNTATTQPLVINSPMDGFGLSYSVTDNQGGLQSTYNKIAVLPALSPAGLTDQAVLNTALKDISIVQGYAKMTKAANYPLESWLDYQLKDVARMIVSKAGVRGFMVQQGGYDTHSEQALYQPLLLSQLSQSLVNFYEYLASESATSNVVVMTISDFGRRPNVNLDFGTDHGGATVSFVFGDPVVGGAYGNYPSLTKFDKNGNLANNFDFRNVLSDVIVAMGGDPTPIVGQTYSPIGFLAAKA